MLKEILTYREIKTSKRQGHRQDNEDGEKRTQTENKDNTGREK